MHALVALCADADAAPEARGHDDRRGFTPSHAPFDGAGGGVLDARATMGDFHASFRFAAQEAGASRVHGDWRSARRSIASRVLVSTPDHSAPEAPKKPRSRRFFYVRVGVLLAILAGVLLWGWRDVRSRRARNAWDHTLTVAILLVRLEPIDDVAVAALRKQLPALEDRLSAELARYRPGAPHPFRFELKDPVDGTAPPPAPASDGPVDLAKYAYALDSYVGDVDKRAGLDASLYDVRIYVSLRRPRQAEVTLAEGRSQQGGRIGIVEVELDTDAEGAHLPLVVVAHELMHTLGATDKYDASGRTLVPLGLAEPDRVPVFPQRYAEVMARNRPISATVEKVPESFAQIAVGPVTAREIRWTTR